MGGLTVDSSTYIPIGFPYDPAITPVLIMAALEAAAVLIDASAEIGNGTIVNDHISANTIVANEKLVALSIEAGQIASDAIISRTIQAASVSADKISVTDLSSVSVNTGQITVTGASAYIQSDPFTSGALGQGFNIDVDGDAEFYNAYIRGKISTSVFEKASISSIGGNFLVLDSDILSANMTALDASTLTIEGDTTFSVGDMLRIKDETDDEWLEVTNAGSAPTYTVTRDKNSDYGADSNPIWKKGTAVMNYQQSGDGGIFMTASESNAPYLSIFDHAGSPWSATTTRLRIGNLNGFLDYAADIYGIAIGSSAASQANLTFDVTNGLRLRTQTTDKIVLDNSGNAYIAGAVTIGGAAGVLASSVDDWKHASDATKIDGGDIYTNTITATQINVSQLSAIAADLGTITAGTVTGATIQTAASGSRVVLTANDLTGYDGSGNVIFFVDTNTNPGDVKIGNYDTGGKGLFWDDSAEVFNVKGTVNVGTAGEVLIDGTNEIIKVFSTTVTITGDENDDLDWIENSTTEAATLSPDDYTPASLVAHVQTKMLAEGDADTTVTYSSTTRKITIANSTLATLSLLWNSGAGADTTCGEALGFDTSANDTGTLTYTADNEAALRVELGKLS